MISPSGASSHFKDHFENKTNYVRNKVLKYGAEVALNQGDLAIGYIVNIGKAGCFVQIGHNCVVRAGLNELSDRNGFDF